jgi:hypothetical protein
MRREEKRARGKELERLTNIFQRRKTNTPEQVETPKTMQDTPRGKKKIKKQRFVMPMRGASFLVRLVQLSPDIPDRPDHADS